MGPRAIAAAPRAFAALNCSLVIAMNRPPCSTKGLNVSLQQPGEPIHFRPGKSKILTQFDRTSRTVQIEHCLPPPVPDMYMSRTMIVRIDHYPHPPESENRRH